MENEFTAYGNLYYKLKQALLKRNKHLQILLDNAPDPTGMTKLSDLDAVISYGRKAKAAKKKVDDTELQLKETARDIVLLMKHFDIPPFTWLTGQIPGELEYELFTDENENVFIMKTKSLAAEPCDPNIIRIKLIGDSDDDDF